MGIRPEHLSLASATAGVATAHLTVRVDLIEHLGNEAILHGNDDGLEITARLGPIGLPEAGSRASFIAQSEHVHFFDAATQLRVEP